VAYKAQPESGAIRGLLRQVYEWTGSYWELAHLLIRDAECSTNDDARYEYYRAAADIFVNRLGNTEAALAPAQKAKELRPDDHDTLILLADILTHSGHADEAAQMLGPAINAHKRRTPQLAALQHRMAKVYEITGDRQEQLSWLKKAFDVDRKDGVIAAELAHLATELGDYDLALKPLRAITLMETPGPVTRVMALLWEAKIEAARGNRAKAELWAKKALREDPNYTEAEEFLNSIAE
jgi:tetratricopeptide (TPR) repeat protein